MINSSQWTGLYLAKGVDSYSLQVDSCVFKEVSLRDTSFNAPIFLEVSNYSAPAPRFGGVDFTDCSIIYDQAIPFLDMYENLPTSAGMGAVSGNFFLFNPQPDSLIQEQVGSNPNQVQISYNQSLSFPSLKLALQQDAEEYQEASPQIPWRVTLQQGSRPYPVSFTYQRVDSSTILPGRATVLADLGLPKGFGLIPPGSSTFEGYFIGRADTLLEAAERLRFLFPNTTCQSLIEGATLSFLLVDSLKPLTIAEPVWRAEKLGPNPVSEVLYIGEQWRNRIEVWMISDPFGRQWRSWPAPWPAKLDLSTLPPGPFMLWGIQNGRILFQQKMMRTP